MLGLLGAACDSQLPVEPRVCTAIAVEALNITVADAVTGRRLCDAVVTVTDGGFSAELRRFGGASDCVHTGPTERPGRYDVRAMQPGYEAAVRLAVTVTADECHVIPVSLTIPLAAR